jgi:hypothetical protein
LILIFRSKEWKGAWGDSSSKWTKELREQLEVKELDDGTFWISVVDFVKFFEGVGKLLYIIKFKFYKFIEKIT